MQIKAVRSGRLRVVHPASSCERRRVCLSWTGARHLLRCPRSHWRQPQARASPAAPWQAGALRRSCLPWRSLL